MSTASTAAPEHVSIVVKHRLDQDGEYRAFTDVMGDIQLSNKTVGEIQGTIVDRRRIPRDFFMSAMDGHSGELQFVGSSLFEPKRGRTKLQSLAEDDMRSGEFLYISKLHVSDECKVNGASDVGALALHKFLNHARIQKKVSTAIYILDPTESMTEAEKQQDRYDYVERVHAMFEAGGGLDDDDDDPERKRQQKARLRADANQFLRNGFFQEPAMVRSGDERFVVCSSSLWCNPIKPHQEVASIVLADPPTVGNPHPTGKDMEIMKLIKSACINGEGHWVSAQQVAKLTLAIANLVHQGGSVARSNALHFACANNKFPIVQVLLETDPTAVNAHDFNNATPLMVAATSVAGRRSRDEMPETRVVEALLRAGADKGLQDSKGMTAHGHFIRAVKGYDISIHAMTGGAVARNSAQDPSVQAFASLLLPPGGATASDLVGGEMEGFVHHYDDDDYTW